MAGRGATDERIDVPVTSDISGFSPKMAKAADDTARFRQRVERDMQKVHAATTKAAGKGGSGGGGITGVAYGLSDAATAYQFNGLKGAAMGVSNNLPAMGEAVASVGLKMAAAGGAAAKFGMVLARFAGPAGLIASIALPLAAIFLPKLFETESATEKAAAATNKWAESLKKLDEASAKQRERADDWKAVDKGGKSATATVEKQREEVRKLADELKAAKQGHAVLVGTLGTSMGTKFDKEGEAALRLQVKESEKTMKERQAAYEDGRKNLEGMEARQRRLDSEAAMKRHQESGAAVAQDNAGRLSISERDELYARKRKEELDRKAAYKNLRDEGLRLKQEETNIHTRDKWAQDDFDERRKRMGMVGTSPSLAVQGQGAGAAITSILNEFKKTDAEGRMEQEEKRHFRKTEQLLSDIKEKIAKNEVATTKAANLMNGK